MASDHVNEALDAVMYTVWLHGNWRYLTKQMTTEEKEAAWAAVQRYQASLGEPPLDEDLWVWWR